MNETQPPPRRADAAGTRLTKRDRIVAELRAMIANGDLPRGARVQQDDLAARFKTSITPVREALRQLEAEGLLVGEPHRGVRVSDTSVDEQLGVYVARRLLEPFATQLATQNITRKDIARARELVRKMEQAGIDGDAGTVRDANRDFHFLLYERSEIPSLTRIIDGIWASFPWDTLEVLDLRATQSVEEHEAIISAVAEGDLAGARRCMEEHIARSYHSLVAHLGGGQAADDPFALVGA